MNWCLFLLECCVGKAQGDLGGVVAHTRRMARGEGNLGIGRLWVVGRERRRGLFLG